MIDVRGEKHGSLGVKEKDGDTGSEGGVLICTVKVKFEGDFPFVPHTDTRRSS